ncbi:unnamed protein product [Orchesella dallaii]|uniref:Uncharacterized protein n=1 Tax=Orchesella dallaii TaxID=48710 RepID=A0ABP1PXU8_9HEXA
MNTAIKILTKLESCSIKRCLLLISIVIGLLSFTKHYQTWRHDIERSNQAVRTPFFIAHVIDPTVDNRFTSWTHQEWLNWLREREILHRRANSNANRRSLMEKGINSVIIATPRQILYAFGNKQQYNSKKHAERDVYWADAQFPSFVFLRSGNGNSYRIYECPPMYIAVKLIRGMPVHLLKHGSKMEAKSNVKVSKDCRLLK